MIVHRDRIVSPNDDMSHFDTGTHVVYWKGLVFLDGHEDGAQSIREFGNEARFNLPAAAARLHGLYFVVVREKRSGETYAFCDQSGLYHVFASDNAVSSSQMELAAEEHLGFRDMDPEAMVDFLSYGYLTFGRTLFRGLHRIAPEEIAYFRPAMPASMLPKPVRKLDDSPVTTVEDILHNLAVAARSRKVSVDLTGGVDTRLVAITLDYFGLSFEVAHAGTKGNVDMAIAEEVAHVLGRELQVTYHDVTAFESCLPEAFVVSDGLLDITKDHLGLQMQHERLARGISLVVTGDGGTLHKDHYWLHDFPFYAKKHANLSKLLLYRVAPLEPDYSRFSEPYAQHARTYRTRAMNFMRTYAVQGNTQTFDQVYFHLHTRDNLGRFSSNHVRLLDVYSPLAERDAVAYSYHLPRFERFFNNFHRKSMTRLNPRAARVPTSEGGVSGSAETTKIAADLARYTWDKLLRIKKKLDQRFRNRPYAQETPINPAFHPAVRSCQPMKDAIRALQDYGILNPAFALDQIPNGELGPILTLHLTLKCLESKSRVAAA